MADFALSLHQKGHYLTYFEGRQAVQIPLPGEDWHTGEESKCLEWLATHHPERTHLTYAGTIRYPRAKDHLPMGNPLASEHRVFLHFDLGWAALQKVAGSAGGHFLWTDDWTYALGKTLPELNAFVPSAGQYPVWWQDKAYQVACLFAGNEQERQINHLCAHFGVEVEAVAALPYQPATVRKLRERFSQVIPTQASTDYLVDCPFVERSLNSFRNLEEAYHQFMLDLVAQQVAAWTGVQTFQAGEKIWVGGKLAESPHFMYGLAEAFFAQEVYAVTGVCLPEWSLLNPTEVSPKVERYL